MYLFVDAPQFLAVFSACYHFNKNRKWRRTLGPQKPLASRLAFLFCCAMIFFSLWGSWFYFNCKVESSEGQEPIKCRDAVKHIFTSPIFNEFLDVAEEVWRVLQEHDFEEAWKQLIGAMDPTGETNALKVSHVYFGSCPIRADLSIIYKFCFGYYFCFAT